MPSEEDVHELIENTYHKYVANYKNIKGLCGELFTSKVNPENQLFIPCEYNEYKTFQSSNCWINSIDKKTPYEAYCLYFDDSIKPRIVSNYRALFKNIRPVINL
jgi:hypothetical protein